MCFGRGGWGDSWAGRTQHGAPANTLSSSACGDWCLFGWLLLYCQPARMSSGICGRSSACTCSICRSSVVFQEVVSTVNVPAAPVHKQAVGSPSRLFHGHNIVVVGAITHTSCAGEIPPHPSPSLACYSSPSLLCA